MHRHLNLIPLALLAANCGPDTTPATDAGSDAAETDAEANSDATVDADTTPDVATCNDGFRLEDAECVDIDECAEDPEICGPPELATCENRTGMPPRCVCDASALVGQLVDGISDFDTQGALPSMLVVHGRGAFPVVVDSRDRPMAAGALFGDGKVFTIAHEGLMNRGGDDPLALLIRNVAEWMAPPSATTVIGVDAGQDGAAANLGFLGYTVTRVDANALSGVDVFVTTNYNEYDEAQLAAIETFVANGGGLITGGHAWWWGRDRDDEVENFPGNRTLRPFGITVTGDTVDDGAYDLVAFAATELEHAACALDALVDDRDAGTLTDEERSAAANAAGRAVSSLPIESPYFEDASRFAEDIGPIIPTSDDPVVQADEPVDALALRVQIRLALDAAAEDVEAHPAGDDFPGPVAADAERVSRTITIDGTYDGLPVEYAFSDAEAAVWRSTGLYAAPGDRITVTVDERFTHAGVGIRIGAHTDELWGLEEWRRVPRLTRHQVLVEPTTTIANGFGGPVYLTVRWGAELGPIDVTIDGAVEAPRFEPGVSGADWADGGDAPWAEFDTGPIIISVPTEGARAIDDVSALAAFWVDVMDAANALTGLDGPRERPERFLVDRQISAGWMHSGYPIMAHLESTGEVTTAASLTTVGAWGPFHELGHNYQWSDWVLPGTVETSCNFWSVYISENVSGVDRGDAHEAISASARERRVAEWQANPDFANWSVWVALETFLQLQEEFGWELLTDLFEEYRTLSTLERPATDEARIQQWVIRSSRATGRDLTPFYDAWSFPIADATREAVGDLPPWDDHPMAE